MKSVRRLFADFTRALEDMHGITVEGQAPRLSPDLQSALLVPLKQGLVRLDCIARQIEKRLEAQPDA